MNNEREFDPCVSCPHRDGRDEECPLCQNWLAYTMKLEARIKVASVEIRNLQDHFHGEDLQAYYACDATINILEGKE